MALWRVPKVSVSSGKLRRVQGPAALSSSPLAHSLSWSRILALSYPISQTQDRESGDLHLVYTSDGSNWLLS